jgi:hypothetical protein
MNIVREILMSTIGLCIEYQIIRIRIAIFLSYKPIGIEDVNTLYSDVKDSIRLTYHLLRFDNLFDLNYS